MSSDEEDIDLNDDAGSQQDQDASDVDEIMETEGIESFSKPATSLLKMIHTPLLTNSITML